MTVVMRRRGDKERHVNSTVQSQRTLLARYSSYW